MVIIMVVQWRRRIKIVLSVCVFFSRKWGANVVALKEGTREKIYYCRKYERLRGRGWGVAPVEKLDMRQGSLAHEKTTVHGGGEFAVVIQNL